MPVGVVVMAYGTPSGPQDVEPYYTHIRRGRPPTPEQLAELTARYEAIGGVSPLRQITEAQRRRIAGALGEDYQVELGMKHAEPFIEDAVAALAGAGTDHIVGVVLAPHHSRGSVGEYVERLAAAAAGHGIGWSAVERWHDLPEWRAFQADAVTGARRGLDGARVEVLFTAHSLPERVLEGDPYPAELAESAAAIARAAGLAGGTWRLAWQSAGRTPEPWAGPDILDVLTEIGAGGTADAVVICPQGFTADHLEVLYDLDIQAAERAEQLGLGFARTRSVNDDETVMTALAERIAGRRT